MPDILHIIKQNKPIGMITDRDITIRTVAHNKNPLQMIAGEIMTDYVVTVTPETSTARPDVDAAACRDASSEFPAALSSRSRRR